MADYRVEIRLAGYAKEHARRLIYAVARRFNLRGVTKDHPLPSITLVGPFKASSDEEAAAAVEGVASGFDLVSYRIRGFSHFEASRKWLVFDRGMKGIFLEVEPSEKLRHLQAELAMRLSAPCDGAVPQGEHSFHATLDLGDVGSKFDGIVRYLVENQERDLAQRVLRLTVMHGSACVCEYDFLSGKMTPIARQRDGIVMRRTLGLIRRTGAQTLTPIWDQARRIAVPRLRVRQSTLVEEDPSARIPRMFLIKGAARGRRKSAGDGAPRQLTLVDDPALRAPRMMVPRSRERGKTKDADGRHQTTLSGSIVGAEGFVIPVVNIPIGRGAMRKRLI